MGFGRQVERWRYLATREAGGIPVNLILSIIWHESGGRAGAIGSGATRCAMLPSSAGARRACRALGLMQVVPRNVSTWNKKHPDRIVTYDDMIGATPASAAKQIKLGVKVLRGSLAWLTRYGFAWPVSGGDPDPEQVKVGLMVYAWGQGNIAPYLDELQAAGKPITAAAIAAAWPNLGKPKNQPLRYSRRVWNKFSGRPDARAPKSKRSNDSFGWGILAIAAIVAIASKGKTKWAV